MKKLEHCKTGYCIEVSQERKRRSQSSLGTMNSEKGPDVGLCLVMQGIMNKYQDFKKYPLVNWQPVEFLEHWCDMVKFLASHGKASCCILDTL